MLKKRLASGLGVNILLLGIVSFLNDVGSEMIAPVLPTFILALGGGSIAVGLIGGLRDSMTSLVQVISGYWSDKLKNRKLFVFNGYATSTLSKFLLSLSKAWSHAAMFVTLDRVGKGLRTAPRDAIIAESTSKTGKSFGLHRAFDTAGAIVGSLLALLLFSLLHFNIRAIILIAACIASLSLFPLLFVIPTKPKRKPVKFTASLKQMPKKLKLFIAIAALFALSNFSYMFFLLKVNYSGLFTQEKATIAAMMLYVLFNIFYASFAVPFGKLSDKVGKIKILAIGYLLFAITALGFAFFTSIPAFILLFSSYGLSYAIVNANQRALIADLAALKGTSLGIFHAVVGLCTLLGNIIAGLLWKINVLVPFVYAAVVAFVASLLLVLSLHVTS